MSEKEATESLQERLECILPKLSGGHAYSVKKKANLLYELFLTDKMELYQTSSGHSLADPRRGFSAFQTDLSIWENIDSKGTKIPKVVLECKTRLSSHDVMTYSYKAQKHKEIYPFLRYGLVIFGKQSIPGRFFIHNIGFDFVLALKNMQVDDKQLKDVIEEQLKMSKCLVELHFKANDIYYFTTIIKKR